MGTFAAGAVNATITITNPNYVPFSLVNLTLSLWHDDSSAGQRAVDDLPLVTLRAQGRGGAGSGTAMEAQPEVEGPSGLAALFGDD